MQLSAVLGQEKVVHNLVQYYESGQLPHAILILGKEGVGGLPLAVAFAKYLLCENKQPDGKYCCACTACLKTKNLVHPDLHFTFPSIPVKGENLSRLMLSEFREFFSENPYGDIDSWLEFIEATSFQKGNISAAETREIIENLNLKAAEGQYKIQIIWRPEYLGKEGNVLLKLIEEPPPDTLFLLVAENADAILETILSRTQLVRLAPLSVLDVQGVLENVYGIAAKEAAQAAQIADGNVAQALSFVQDSDSDMMTLLRDWFNGIFTHNGDLLGKWTETVSKKTAAQQKNVLLFVQQILANTLRASLVNNWQPLLPPEELQFVQKLAARKLSPDTIAAMDKVIGEAIYHIDRNVNAKVVLLHLSVAMQYILKGSSLTLL